MRVYTDERMLLHDAGAAQPERPARLKCMLDRLQSEPLPGVQLHGTRLAEWAEIERVHDADYVQKIQSLSGQVASLDWDTNIAEHSVPAARLAAGAGLEAVDAILSGEILRAFAWVRPPGHHAERDRAMGYCIFNNIAIAAEHALQHDDIERVLIVDWDVHHGNGTAHIFDERADVLVFNCHQSPLYPGTGRADERGSGPGEGFTINVPLAAGCGDQEYEAAFLEHLLPAAAAFRPQLVLISAGFDAHERDPLGSMQVTDAGFARLAGLVLDIANQHAQGRVLAMLEGGYDLEGLAGGVWATMGVLREG